MKWSLRRVRLNSQGYTSEGYYYGAGAPLWHAQRDDGKRSEWFRAGIGNNPRVAARDYIRKIDPAARFYR